MKTTLGRLRIGGYHGWHGIIFVIFRCILTKLVDEEYVSLFNSYVKFHVNSAGIAEILTKVTGGLLLIGLSTETTWKTGQLIPLLPFNVIELTDNWKLRTEFLNSIVTPIYIASSIKHIDSRHRTVHSWRSCCVCVKVEEACSSFQRAGLLVSWATHSGDWLLNVCTCISVCGLRLDDEAIHVAVALRFELTSARHTSAMICRCDANVDPSSVVYTVWYTRHHTLNDCISALHATGNPANKEPPGLVHSDGEFYCHPVVQWQVYHMRCYGSLHGGGFLFKLFRENLVQSLGWRPPV